MSDISSAHLFPPSAPFPSNYSELTAELSQRTLSLSESSPLIPPIPLPALPGPTLAFAPHSPLLSPASGLGRSQ